MSNSELTYHSDGTVTFKDEPKNIVATWEYSKGGAFNVFAYPDGKERGFAIHDSPRSLADDYVRIWIEMIHGSKEQIQNAA